MTSPEEERAPTVTPPAEEMLPEDRLPLTVPLMMLADAAVTAPDSCKLDAVMTPAVTAPARCRDAPVISAAVKADVLMELLVMPPFTRNPAAVTTPAVSADVDADPAIIEPAIPTLLAVIPIAVMEVAEIPLLVTACARRRLEAVTMPAVSADVETDAVDRDKAVKPVAVTKPDARIPDAVMTPAVREEVLRLAPLTDPAA